MAAPPTAAVTMPAVRRPEPPSPVGVTPACCVACTTGGAARGTGATGAGVATGAGGVTTTATGG